MQKQTDEEIKTLKRRLKELKFPFDALLKIHKARLMEVKRATALSQDEKLRCFKAACIAAHEEINTRLGESEQEGGKKKK